MATKSAAIQLAPESRSLMLVEWQKMSKSGIGRKVATHIRRSVLGALFLFFAMSMAAIPAHGQANVNEGQESNFIYVDTVNGNNSNPGTQAEPLQTIGAAVTLATAIAGTTGSRIIVNPGTYRESISFINAPANSLPITVQAATNGTVTISGADVWTGWQAGGGNPNIYTNAWPYAWGTCPGELTDGAPYQTELMLRREMVFINGSPLTQVLSLSDMVYPGMLYVNETSGTIYIWPPTGTDISTATVEVSTRDPLVTVDSYNNLVFRGLTFQYDNACHNGSAVWVEYNSNNILFDTDITQWNNARGLYFFDPVTDVTVQNTSGLHNGQNGFQDFKGLNMEYTNDTVEYNNWRGAEGSYYSWGVGGIYFSWDHNDAVSNITALYQPSNGIHWDTDNVNSTATNITAAGNMLNGIFYENDLGPLTLSNSIIADNMPNPAVYGSDGGGILFRYSENITLTNDKIFGNGNSQLYVNGSPGGILITDWMTGQTTDVITQDLTFQQDVIESITEASDVFEIPFLDGADWTSFYTTLNSSQNTWWNAANSFAYVEPTPNTNTAGNLATWQATTGQDLNSTFQEPIPDPAQSFTLPPPDYPDYWLAVDNSTLQVAADGTAVFNISTIPVGSFSGNVSLLLDGVSEVPGLSGSLSATTISVPGTTTLNLASVPRIVPGTYPITVVSNQANATRVVQFNVIIATSSLRITPATLNFPSTQVNYSSTETATATNYGKTPITITSIVPPAPFTESDNCHGLIPVGGSCTLTVVFAPTGAGTFSSPMIVTDSDPTSPQTITLNAISLAGPQVSLSSYTLLYGNVAVGQNAVLTSVLSNTGGGALDISSVVIGGTNAGDFTQSNTCGTTVQAGGTCTFTVTFTPVAVNQRSSTLTISDNVTSGATQMITLSGTGTQPTVQLPATLNFNSVVIGSSTSNNVTLMNGGNGTLNISGIAISGVNAHDFTESNTCGTQVLPFANCTITVTYAPTVLGAESASLLVTDNAPNSPQSVALSGTGTAPALTFTPDPAAFGNQTVNTTSSGLPITITNSGTATVTISSLTITGTNASNFTIAQSCGQFVLTAGNSCTATLKFTPTSMGAFSAFLTVTSNAPGSPANIPLTGTGVQAIVSLSPTSLSFGNQLENMTSAAQNVTLTNTGNTALSITKIAITGTDATWYAESNTCGTSVAAGASCTISATFTPLQGGPASPSINLTDTGTGSPQSITLSGTGVIPTATLAPMSLNFGNVNLGTSSSPLTATLTNSGTAALALSSIGISGTNSNDYSETNTCGTSVPIGATCMITVAFTPQATGSTSADVTFTDDAKNSPQSLSLSGTGTVPGISFNPTSVSFGTQTVGKKSAGQKITVTNTGTGTLTLTSVTLTGANPGDFSLTDGCGTSLSAGKTCTVTAFFDPTLTGLRSADVTFADNAPGGPQEVALTGTGD
jgi:hypothetical protein